MFGAELKQCRLHLLGLLSAEHLLFGCSFVVEWFLSHACFQGIHRNLTAAALCPPAMRARQIQRNAIHPRIKLGRPAKRVELAVCLDERILQHLAGVVGTTQHSQQGVEQSLLVSLDQRAEGLTVPPLSGRHQFGVARRIVVAGSNLGHTAARLEFLTFGRGP